MKRFGYHPEQIYHHMRNPQKVKYIYHQALGNFEIPKNKDTSDVNILHKNYTDRLDFEKYMNPKGLKTTITSRFTQPAKEIDFLNENMVLTRSPKPYKKNVVSFRVSPFLSKPEIKQYLGKVYNLPVLKVETANKIGKIKRDRFGGSNT